MNSDIESALKLTMEATVLSVERCRLSVCDHRTHQKVIVNSPAAQCFRPGDEVCIEHGSTMTMSIPPQITGTRITKLSSC